MLKPESTHASKLRQVNLLNVTNGEAPSKLSEKQSDAASQEDAIEESSGLSEPEGESEGDTRSQYEGDENEHYIETSGDRDEESESTGEITSGSNFSPSDCGDDASSNRTLRPRTRSQSFGASNVDSEFSSLHRDEEDDSSSLTQPSDEEDSDAEASDTGKSNAKFRAFATTSALIGEFCGSDNFSEEDGDDEEDDSEDDASWHPRIDSRSNKASKWDKNREATPSEEERARLRSVFKIDIQSTFGRLRLPYFPDPLLVGAAIPDEAEESAERQTPSTAGVADKTSVQGGEKNPQYYDASTITRGQLKGRDLWEFVLQMAWKSKGRSPRRPSPFYQPLKIEQDRPSDRIFDPPTDLESVLGTKIRIHGNIQAHFNWLKYFIEVTKSPLYIATELVRSDKLLEKRPALPEAYEAALKADNLKTPLRRREETPPPAGYGPPSTEASPANEAILKHQGYHDIGAPSSVSKNNDEATVGPSTRGARKFEIPTRNTSVADLYIQQNGLTCSKLAAEQVAKYLLPAQRTHDLEDSKLKLSNLTGVKGGEATRINCIIYMPREEIDKKDQIEHCGNIMLDKAIPYADLISAKKAIQWLEYTGEEIALAKSLSEIEVEQEVGRNMWGIFSSPRFHQTSCLDLHFQQHLRLFGTTPRPDIAVRAQLHAWKCWGDRLRPCLFVGDSKVLRNDRQEPKWAAQLAMAMGPTLNILTLIHLDTREVARSLMPHWMWLPGVIYTQSGFTIYAHHPGVFSDKAKGNWKWKHVSVELSTYFRNIYPTAPDSGLQAQALQTMCMFRSHSEFVLEQMEAWSKTRGQLGGGIMDQFIARSHYDQGHWRWLRKNAATYARDV